MFVNKSSLLLLSLGSFPGLSDAFWRMSCSIIQTGRLDPIVSPGEVSSHVHKISGASSKCSISGELVVRDALKISRHRTEFHL